MKDVPSSCEHIAPTKADVLAREKAPGARRLSLSETLVLITLGGAAGFYALQPAPRPFAPPVHAGAPEAAAARDDARPRW